MQVSKEIVRDLLPVYLAGEASADTRAAVEEWLAADPDLREIVEADGGAIAPPIEPPPELEQRSLQRTRRLLARKNAWLASAMILSVAPLLVRPLWAADVTMGAALAAWGAFLATCRGLSPTGLELPRRWSTRVAWSLVGWLVGVALGSLIGQQTAFHHAMTYFACIIPGVAMWLGEKLHQMPTVAELSRPTTLFGN